jgi:2-octaprenyl-6-methoxyphenol hydroxylase
MTTHETDIAVIGAGPNGLAAAMALGGHTLLRPQRIIVIDPVDPRTRGAKADSRASALSSATQTMFGALGLWQDLQHHAQDMRDIIVTDGPPHTEQRPSLLSFITDEGDKAAAAMVENQYLMQALVKGVEASPDISLLTGVTVLEFGFGPGKAVLHLSDGTTVKAKLIVAADGRNSPARNAAGIACEQRPYGQTAITATVQHELPHNGTAEEHFNPHGVFAILPLTGQRSSLVWTETPDVAQHLMTLAPAEFLHELSKRFGSHRGALSLIGPHHAYPLSLQIAKEFCAPRLALLGDAAHVVHPLAGLGLNLGFKDAAALSDIVSDAASLGEDIGSIAVLGRYQAQRRFDAVATSALIDGMNRLFANDNPVLKNLRDTGLRIVDRLPPIKALLMQQASGQSSSTPRLMRGLVG